MAKVMEASLLAKFLVLLEEHGVFEIHASIPADEGREMAPDLTLHDSDGAMVKLEMHDLETALLDERQIVAASVDLSRKVIFDRLDLREDIAPEDGHMRLRYRIGSASLDLVGWSGRA